MGDPPPGDSGGGFRDAFGERIGAGARIAFGVVVLCYGAVSVFLVLVVPYRE